MDYFSSDAYLREDIQLLLSTFEEYKRKPRWSLLQGMFRLAFSIGYECARRDILYEKEKKK